MKRALLVCGVLGLAACGGKTPAEPDAPGVEVDAPARGDILDELKAVPGVSNVEERETIVEGYRFFTFAYEQPVDHKAPGGAVFAQRMTLMHRDYAAPVVAHNSGYHVSTRGSRSSATIVTNGNQLSMEHRFFTPSRPEPADWDTLTIEQAANDQHRITQALKAHLYRGNKWLDTGASKGGMTSLFHRRFFPDDVDGTVAFVAPFDYPEDAVQSPTNRYIVFLENVGTSASCRQRLKDFQNLVLARREAMKTRMRAAATFGQVLDEDRALEFAVEETPFIFWQYGSQEDCASIPAASATDGAVFQFLDNVVDIASYGDDDLTAFLPYYHQSATQLGYPISDESYLVGLLHPGEDTAEAYVPAAIPRRPYDEGAAMTDVQAWIATSGSQILLIYGQNDPWTAGAVDLGAAADSFKLIAPRGNHGSTIGSLAQGDQAIALSAVRRWAGLGEKPNNAPAFDPAERTLEQEEFAERRRRRR
ncbi:MAG: aminopeptidase [Deltaproteobacteria bacterium]|nr:aminopeptidase [Deltaproteobacteria bacterium]